MEEHWQQFLLAIIKKMTEGFYPKVEGFDHLILEIIKV